MKFKNIRVHNFENALRGMRNPKNSWHLSDSVFGIDTSYNVELTIENLYEDEDETISAYKYKDHILYTDKGLIEYAFIGPKDMKLAKTLIKAGPEHRKFLRQIYVSVDITAPLYW